MHNTIKVLKPSQMSLKQQNKPEHFIIAIKQTKTKLIQQNRLTTP